MNPNELTVLQRLALVGSNGRGALEFRPDHSVNLSEELPDFDQLAKDAEKILQANGDEKSSAFVVIIYKFGADRFRKRKPKPC